MAFTDLDEELENLGYKTLDFLVEEVSEDKQSRFAAFLADYKKWMREKPEEYKAWRRLRYKEKRRDPKWRENERQTRALWALKNKEKIKKANRAARKRWWAKKKKDPVFMAKIRARDRERKRKQHKAKKTYKSKWQQLTLPIKEAA